MSFQVTLGNVYRDKLYGFQGKVEARVEYPFETNRILIIKLTEEGELESGWFAEPQLDFVEEGPELPPESKPVESRVKLTEEYTDKLYGFTGIAAARSEWLYGCNRVHLQKQKANGELVGYWFDEPQIQGIERETKERPAGGRMDPPV